MAKTKKISIGTFDKIVKDTYTPTEVVEWNGTEVIIKRSLSFTEMITFVNNVVKTCFSSENGEYIPEVKDFIIKTCILDMYANFSLPDNIEHKYNLIYNSNAVQVVLNYINRQQFEEILQSIDDKIDHIAQANIEATTKQMNELYSSLNNLQSQFSEIFAGIKSEDMSGLLKAVSENKIDENKLVKAYVEQTKLKTDTEPKTKGDME